jgi:arylsulfatase A-like enzyme
LLQPIHAPKVQNKNYRVIRPLRRWPAPAWAGACFLLFIAASLQAASPRGHVVVVVWDGMRPDFVSEQNTPTLATLAKRGVTFRNHHSVFPSSTEVNGAAISTGSYPVHSGIIANNEYRPSIDPLKPIHTETLEAVRKGDQLTRGGYVRRPTIAEVVRRAGGKTVVAGAKPVVLLADRSQRLTNDAGMNVFAGVTLPSTLLPLLTNRYGRFPIESSLEPSRNDWVIRVVADPLWQSELPAFSFIWMNEPDFTQHQTGPGSVLSITALRRVDRNLAQLLQALEARGALESTDLIVVSDHGFSTVSSKVDLVESLQKAGLNAMREFASEPKPGEILVVSNSGSVPIYVVGHEEAIIRRIIAFLQSWEFTGVIFSRQAFPGTFSLKEARIDSDTAPDIFVSLRWSAEKNRNGTPGMIVSDVSAYAVSQGTHVTLSPFDLHATLIAAGPHFRSGVVDTLATGNVDIAPTVLFILGLHSPQPSDGRVLTEALTIMGPKLRSFQPRHLEATADLNDVTWTQYLNVTEVNGVRYLDEGNGKQTRRD